MSASRVGMARKPGRPVKANPAKVREAISAPHRTCPYHGDDGVCGNPVGKFEPFCIEHSLPAKTAGGNVERKALGEEAATRLREELNVDQVARDCAEKEASPAVNEAQEIQAQMRAMLGQAPEPTRVKPAETPISEAVAIQNLAVEMVRQQQETLEARKAGRKGKGSQNLSATGLAQQSIAAHFPEMPDPTAMVDSHGKSLVKPGYKGRWVRLVDNAGKPSNRRLQEYRLKLGAEDVMDEFGKPLETEYGKAIQAPYAMWARFAIYNSQVGTFDTAAYQFEQAQIAADNLNRSVNRNAVHVFADEAHGSGDYRA